MWECICMQFPYYIVRFKQIIGFDGNKKQGSFHTTQYDLNSGQYVRTAFGGGKFPYYIVRFKQIYHKSIHCRRHRFPYYIVRFKPDDLLCAVFCASISFHTTQYDLNSVFPELNCFEINRFPYYIVRFKLASRRCIFHRRKIVSILHSTI